jgi:hypothetical protein
MNDIGQINRVKSLINNFRSASDVNMKNETLKQLKIMVLNFTSLPPFKGQINPDEFYLAREIFELEMEQAILNRNEKDFDLAYLKIKQFYFDYR